MTETAAQRIRAQAKDATRRALLEAGLAESVALGGLEQPSIEAICARAGYTRGAFYVHFRDRDQFEAEMFEWVLNDILRTLWVNAVEQSTDVRDIVARFSQRMADRNWPDLQGDIRAGYLSVLREITGGAKKTRDRHAKLMSDVVAMLEMAIETGQTEGTIRREVEPHTTATLIVLLAIATIVWDDIGIEIDPKALGSSLIQLLEPSPR